MSVPNQLTKPFLSLAALFTAMSSVNAQPNAVVEATRQRMASSAGAPVQMTTSATTELATFIAATPQKPIPTTLAATTSAVERGQKFLELYGAAFGITAKNQVQLQRNPGRDNLGMEHVRFQQAKNGIPVRGGEIIVHLRGANATAITAKTLPAADLERVATTPTVTAQQATDAAKALLAKQLKVIDATLSVPKLEIFNEGLFENWRSPTRLSWFIEATAFNLREQIWIDAERSAVLLHFNQLANALNREVYTADDTDELPGELIRSEGEPATDDADADAAYDYAGDTYNYFFNQHGRDSYDDKGAKIISTVHYCEYDWWWEEMICPYENAFWDGTQMVYGEGYSQADDVVAHELTHAVTENSTSLAYIMQSGALNESYSDIFGETVDLTNNKGTDTVAVRWLMGEDIVSDTNSSGAIRNMMYPNEFYDPAKVSDFELFICNDLYNDLGGVHSNSGVPNHAYALMADGGTFNDQTVSGIGLIKAGKIQYRSLIAYLTSTADFQANYTALQQACNDLVGTAGITANDCVQVKKALDAVEMNLNNCTPPATPALCPIGQVPTNLFFDDLENTKSGKWATVDVSGDYTNHWDGGEGTPDIYWAGYPTSGLYHFWGYNYGWLGDSAVNMTSNVTLPAGSRMQFNHLFDFECGYDGGVVEYSVNNGSSWLDAGVLITDGHKYKYAIRESDENPLGGRKGFTCSSMGYAASQLDLSSLSGQNARFRFRVGTDDAVSAPGWFIDDIRIYTCSAAPAAGKLSIADVTKAEGNSGITDVTFTVTLSAASTNTVVVDYATVNGTAIAGNDYTATSGTLIFAPGQTSKTVTVKVTADTAFEANETFVVKLSAASGATLAKAQATGTIQDDDGGLRINDVTKGEGNSGNTALAFTVSLNPARTVPVTVTYATANGTATAGSDYTAVTGSVSFAVGETSKTVTVNVKGDTTAEANETFMVNLTAPTGGATIADNQGIGTILNDDGSLLRIADVTKAEGETGITPVTFTLALAPVSTSPVTVTYATANDTATAGSDYVAIPATVVTFVPGETSKTVTVNLNGDTTVEPNEVLFLNLSNATGATIFDADARGQATIFNDDGATLRISDVAKGEGNSGVTPLAFNLALSQASTTPVTVSYATANDTATAGSDFTAVPTTTLTFAPGVINKTVTVNAVGDAVKEANEVFYLNLSNAVGATIFDTDSRGIGTILNDEGSLLRIADAVAIEGNSGTTPLAFTLTLTPASATPVTVAYATANGTATAGKDYTALPAKTLTFAANQTSQVVNVNVLGDVALEANENLYLNLSNATGATIFDNDSRGTGVIVDDDELTIRSSKK